MSPPPPRRFSVDRRWMGIALVTEVTAIFLAYMVVNRPVVGALLTPDEQQEHWPVALVSALIVVVGVLFVVRETLRGRRLNPVPAAVPAGRLAATSLPRIPRSLSIERVSGKRVKTAIAISLATIPLGLALAAPLPLWWFAFLAPWIPIVVTETRGKLARDTVYACFGLLVILQLLHMVEHSVQVGQLLVNDGALGASHGIFGQLDFELVHFVTDSTLWISLGLFVILGRGRNTWLLVAFAAAAFHQVEHNYLIWLNNVDNTFYLSGGFAGILGENGLIGSPLDRPYLHYTYNFIVFVPMVIALWDAARRLDRERPEAVSAGAAHGPTESANASPS